MQYCFYRYHVLDPIYFRKDIRVTIQQIGCLGPETRGLFYFNEDTVYSRKMEKMDFSKDADLYTYALFERADDWSSCSYFYLDSPMIEP